MGLFHNIAIGATRVPVDDMNHVEMRPDASKLPLGQKSEGIAVKSQKYKLLGIYEVKHSDDGSYRFTFIKPMDPSYGGKRNRSRKVRRNRKRNTRRR